MEKKESVKKAPIKASKKEAAKAPIIKKGNTTLLKDPKICLVMIVKNESNVIKRCIDSVKDYISHWVIVDTGSTDGTQDLIRKIMDEYKIPGDLYERPWVDFGFNRTESLNYSKGICDYRLIIDADDVLLTDNGANPFKNLDKDSYKVRIKLNALAYFRTQLVRSNQDWKYVGVLHEYISGPENTPLTEDFLTGAEMNASVSGHNRDIKGTDKYYSDALLFEKALLTTPKEDLPIDLERRYQFYLAQSYRDAVMLERSIEAYQKRADLGGWEEEVYISKYWVARQKHIMEKPDSEIINAYLEAWESRPTRLESLYHLVKFLGSKKRYALAFAMATIGMKSAPCQDILFVEEEIWKWRMPDEYSVLAYYNGNPEEAIKMTSVLLNTPQIFDSIPPMDQERIKKNIGFYEEGLKEQKAQREQKEQKEQK